MTRNEAKRWAKKQNISLPRTRGRLPRSSGSRPPRCEWEWTIRREAWEGSRPRAVTNSGGMGSMSVIAMPSPTAIEATSPVSTRRRPAWRTGFPSWPLRATRRPSCSSCSHNRTGPCRRQKRRGTRRLPWLAMGRIATQPMSWRTSHSRYPIMWQKLLCHEWRSTSRGPALTVRQPWAWAIVHGPKRVENRTRPTSQPGCILIHAGRSPSWPTSSASAAPAWHRIARSGQPLVRCHNWNVRAGRLRPDKPGPAGPVRRRPVLLADRSSSPSPAAAAVRLRPLGSPAGRLAGGRRPGRGI